MAEIKLTESNFDQVINGNEKVLVDFWAEWCGPCRMLAPTIEELSEEYAGRAAVCKVNVDEEPALAMRFNVSAIPTVIAFQNGREVDRSLGLVAKSVLEDLLK
ncbi:MAG: thioredoxin [Clostridia bacterium]|nr:thioredoxin [Clostridia bacterium]